MIARLVEVAGLALGAALLARVRCLDDDLVPSDSEVSVVIPARDEEATLPVLLRSLARQTRPPRDIVVVDDASRDRTVEVARAHGATVVTAGLPPPGWLGKPWACLRGARGTEGDVLVFLDADTELGPDALARLVGTLAREAPDGLLSVQPFHHTERPHEQLSAIPNLVSMMATGAFTPRGTTAPVAFGPCLVTRRSAYDALGGHASVAAEVVEDLQLARAYASAGRPVHARAGGPDVKFRMYPRGPRQLIEGWTKNLAAGSALAPRLPTIAATAWVGACLSAALGAVVVVVHTASGGPVDWGRVGVSLVAALELRWLLRRVGAFASWTWIAFPVPVVAFVALYLRSLVLRVARRPVPWRGRDVAPRAVVGRAPR